MSSRILLQSSCILQGKPVTKSNKSYQICTVKNSAIIKKIINYCFGDGTYIYDFCLYGKYIQYRGIVLMTRMNESYVNWFLRQSIKLNMSYDQLIQIMIRGYYAYGNIF